MALALTLAILGVLLAVLALLVAIRTDRHVQRLAQALAREWGLRTDGGRDELARAPEPRADAEEQTRLRYALQALEQQVHDLTQRTADASARPARPAFAAHLGAGAEAEPSEHVRRHLEALGYEDIVVMPGRGGPGAFLYEARQEGMPRKGGARVDEAGRVALAPAAQVRAFP